MPALYLNTKLNVSQKKLNLASLGKVALAILMSQAGTLH